MKSTYKNCLFILLVLLISSTATNIAKAQHTLFIDKQEYSCAATFNINIRAKNMTDVVALQGTITWDTTVVKYNGISFGTSGINMDATNVNLSSTSDGLLTFLWYDANLYVRSVSDSASVFTISFITNGSLKGTSPVNFSNTPTQLEIDTLTPAGFPSSDATAVFTNGYIVTPSLYTFIGSGNWDVASSWKNNVKPPSLLPNCSEILIDPAGTAECILNQTQTILPGARISVSAGKKLRIPGNLTVQ